MQNASFGKASGDRAKALPQAPARVHYAAFAVAALIIVLTVVLVPYGEYAGPKIAPVEIIYAIVMSLVQALTAYFLAIQCRSTGNALLGGISGAFGFVAVVVFTQMLVFPGVFAPHGLFGVGPQTSIWMWVIWHAGFPLFLLAAQAVRVNDPRRAGRLGLALVIAGPVLALVCAYVAIAHSQDLPPLIAGGSYAALRRSPAMAVIISATAAALWRCLRGARPPDLLGLWLPVALIAGLADSALTLSGSVRFDLGWYAGRMLSVVSSAVVFCVLILELSRLYDRVVIANATLTQRVMLDGLTGAFNRSYFAEQFPREIRRARRENAVLSILMIDVDHFKAYNDLFGHQQGDVCLRAIVAAMLETARRPGDFVVRYGGEEFAVILPYTDAAGATRVAHDIRNAVADRRLLRQDTAVKHVTVSIGAATFDPVTGLDDADDLIERADLALYQAKNDGRNTVRLAAGNAARATAETSGMTTAGMNG